MFKKEEKLDQFDKEYPLTIKRKEEVINKFTSLQLEDLLNNSTKNVAQEVVTCLIPKRGEGVLVTLELTYPQINANKILENTRINKMLEQTEAKRANLHARSSSQNNTTGGTG